MILLHSPGRGRCVALFGEGLVGSSVLSAFSGCYEREIVGFSYDEPEKQDDDLRALANRIASLQDGSPGSLAAVWAAGKTGFSASEQDAESEVALFRKVFDFAVRQCESSTATRCSFHCVSSAGGLFEGQSHVTDRSVPSPRRPY